MNHPRFCGDGCGSDGGGIAKYGSGGSICIQDVVNDGGSSIEIHGDVDERGRAQDGVRSAEEVRDGCGRVKFNGVGSRCHHIGKGVERRGGREGYLVITYAVAVVAKENPKNSAKI